MANYSMCSMSRGVHFAGLLQSLCAIFPAFASFIRDIEYTPDRTPLTMCQHHIDIQHRQQRFASPRTSSPGGDIVFVPLGPVRERYNVNNCHSSDSDCRRQDHNNATMAWNTLAKQYTLVASSSGCPPHSRLLAQFWPPPPKCSAVTGLVSFGGFLLPRCTLIERRRPVEYPLALSWTIP